MRYHQAFGGMKVPCANEYVLEARFVSEENHFSMNPKVVHELRFFPSLPEVGLGCQVLLKPAPPMQIE